MAPLMVMGVSNTTFVEDKVASARAGKATEKRGDAGEVAVI